MALPEKIPDHWLNCDVKVAVAAPQTRKDGSLDFPTFEAKILADYPQVVELETSENIRLYPKNMVAYLVKSKGVLSLPGGTTLQGSKLILPP